MSPLPKHAFPSWAILADSQIVGDVGDALDSIAFNLDRYLSTSDRVERRVCAVRVQVDIAKARALARSICDFDKRMVARRKIATQMEAYRRATVSRTY